MNACVKSENARLNACVKSENAHRYEGQLSR